MNATPSLPLPVSSLALWLRRALLALLGALLALTLGAVLVLLGVRAAYSGRALPGVYAAGVDLSGMTRPEIELALGEALTYPQTGTIALTDADRVWLARPADLGVVVDIPTMARQALAVGRRGSLADRLSEQAEAWFQGVTIPPVVIFDQRAATRYLEAVAAEIDRPERDAVLRVEGVEVVHEPGQIGRRLDIGATLQALTPAVWRMVDTAQPLVIVETPPRVLDASQEAARTRAILSQPLTLTAEDAGPWQLDPATLASMLRFDIVEETEGFRYRVSLDEAALTAFLEPLAPDLAREPQNARFIFNDETRELDLLQPAVLGRDLNIPATIEAVQKAVREGRGQVPLVFDLTEPAVGSEATAEELGITENVVTVSTYFYGSSPARVHNIKTAAAAFHGLLIAPGETLSMAEVLGDISLDNGYAEALIIFGNRTIKGVGGGVCQVSTTLFRAAFFGGYEIVERHPHAYRVLYYEQGPNSPGPGLDATVFVPMVDFKFTNDSPYWLLMETYIYGSQLVWKFYSTSDGRQVQWSTSGPLNVVEAPKPLYRINPDLPKGEKKQIDFEADGMDVVVTRTVTRDGEVLHEDVFKTHYLPWRAIYEVGPGTEIPKDAEVEEPEG